MYAPRARAPTSGGGTRAWLCRIELFRYGGCDDMAIGNAEPDGDEGDWSIWVRSSGQGDLEDFN